MLSYLCDKGFLVRFILHVSATHSQGGELKIGTDFLNFKHRIELESQKHISLLYTIPVVY